MPGYIAGGWGYVEAAYGLTAFAFSAYLFSVVARLRAQEREARTLHAEIVSERTDTAAYRQPAEQL